MAAWVIAGYARTPQPPDPATHRRWRHSWTQRFHDHATASGYVLGPVRVDAGYDLSGFHDLLARARHGQIVAVLVPGLDHLNAIPALTGADPDTIRRYLRARILTLPEPPASPRHASDHHQGPISAAPPSCASASDKNW